MFQLFWLAFSSTCALLLLALWSGLRRRRKTHFGAAIGSLLGLAVTIYLTERLVASRDFPREELDFHLNFAYAATILTLPVILSGLALARSGRARIRKLHRYCVATFLIAVLVATGTGIWVYSLSAPA
ncbi:MAG: hypothetical protein ACYTG5_08495 [Planctomycetota bacterium]|jgi:undecaprenyl pyrophosphate phosphatase UppP